MVSADYESLGSVSDVRAMRHGLVHAVANLDSDHREWLRAIEAPAVPDDVRGAAHACAVAKLGDGSCVAPPPTIVGDGDKIVVECSVIGDAHGTAGLIYLGATLVSCDNTENKRMIWKVLWDSSEGPDGSRPKHGSIEFLSHESIRDMHSGRVMQMCLHPPPPPLARRTGLLRAGDGSSAASVDAIEVPTVPGDVRAVLAAHVCTVAKLDGEQRVLGGGPTWAAGEVSGVESVGTGACRCCRAQDRWLGCERQRALKWKIFLTPELICAQRRLLDECEVTTAVCTCV